MSAKQSSSRNNMVYVQQLPNNNDREEFDLIESQMIDGLRLRCQSICPQPKPFPKDMECDDQLEQTSKIMFAQIMNEQLQKHDSRTQRSSIQIKGILKHNMMEKPATTPTHSVKTVKKQVKYKT